MRTSFTLLLLIFLFSYPIFAQIPKLQVLNKGPMFSNTALLQDYDGDGDLDIILSQKDPDGIYWMENEPTKQFPKRAIITENIRRIADVDMGDFDNDGDMDYVVSMANSVGANDGELAWYQRQENGAYIKWTIDTNSDFIMASIADFNGDGLLDIAAVGLQAYTDEAKVYINQGNFFFSKKIVANGKVGDAIDADDIDGDGDIDLAIVANGFINAQDGIATGSRTLINDGNANFVVGKYLRNNYGFGFTDLGNEIEITDLNEDGVQDILGFSGTGFAGLNFFNGATSAPLNSIQGILIDDDNGVIDLGGDIVVFDIDGDGRKDIIRQGYSEKRLSVLYQTGNLSFTREYLELNWDNGGNPTAKMAVGDLDNDGDLDLIFPEKGNVDGDVAWFENINGKLYRHYLTNQAIAARIPKFADIDNDGDEDILLTLATDGSFKENEVMLYENLGNNNFLNWRLNDSLDYAADIEPADIDGDGDLDAFVTARDGNDLVWLRNDGIKGNWQTFSIDANANGALGIKAVDLDKDGDVDVVLCSANDDKVFWYRNNGGGNFSKLVVDANVDTPRDVEAADLDGDGDIDLAIACQSTANTVVTYLNNGNQTFTRTIRFTGKTCGDIEIADWNNDSRPDIIFSLSSTSPVNPQQEVVALINQNNNNFTTTPLIVQAEKGTSLKVTDLDKDGDMDIIVGRDDRIRLVAWLQEGGSLRQLVLSNTNSTFTNVLGIDVADTNDDGINDIVFTDFERDELVLVSFDCLTSPPLSVTRKNATCGENNGTATINVSGGSNPTFIWNNGATTQTISNLSTGVYRVTVTVAGGCQSTANVVIGRNAVGNLTLTPTNTSCDKEDGSIAVAVQGGSPIASYLWSTGDTTATIGKLPGGTYSLVAIDTNGCQLNGQATVTGRVSPVIDLGPDLTLTQGQTVTLNALGADLTYMWSTGATTPTITIDTAGTYMVTVTNAQGCIASDEVMVNLITSTTEIKASEAVIMPNPTTSRVTIQFQNKISDKLIINVFDLSGKMLQTKAFLQNDLEKVEIDVSDLPSGVYLVQIQTNQLNGTAKIIKQ